MNADERRALAEELRAEHRLEPGYRQFQDCCQVCGTEQPWPCAAIRAAEALSQRSVCHGCGDDWPCPPAQAGVDTHIEEVLSPESCTHRWVTLVMKLFEQPLWMPIGPSMIVSPASVFCAGCGLTASEVKA